MFGLGTGRDALLDQCALWFIYDLVYILGGNPNQTWNEALAGEIRLQVSTVGHVPVLWLVMDSLILGIIA